MKGINQVKQIYINQTTIGYFNNSNINSLTSYIPDNSFPIDWALPHKHFTRFNYRQLKYIYDLFIQGETGRKASPEKVFNDMKNLRINGNVYFSPKEYLHLLQIKSLFSRYAKLKWEGS